jgi:hypothetical protein
MLRPTWPLLRITKKFVADLRQSRVTVWNSDSVEVRLTSGVYAIRIGCNSYTLFHKRSNKMNLVCHKMQRNRSQFRNCKKDSAEWSHFRIVVCSNNPPERTHAHTHTHKLVHVESLRRDIGTLTLHMNSFFVQKLTVSQLIMNFPLFAGTHKMCKTSAR